MEGLGGTLTKLHVPATASSSAPQCREVGNVLVLDAKRNCARGRAAPENGDTRVGVREAIELAKMYLSRARVWVLGSLRSRDATAQIAQLERCFGIGQLYLCVHRLRLSQI